jgi:hypothetical protein
MKVKDLINVLKKKDTEAIVFIPGEPIMGSEYTGGGKGE